MAKPQAGTVQPVILRVAAAIADVAAAVALRKKRVDAPMEVLCGKPENGAALAQRRAGNILSFAQAETVTLILALH